MHTEVQEVEADQRLDLFLRQRCPELSRSRIQTLVKGGDVIVNGAAVRSAYLVQAGVRIEMTMQLVAIGENSGGGSL